VLEVLVQALKQALEQVLMPVMAQGRCETKQDAAAAAAVAYH